MNIFDNERLLGKATFGISRPDVDQAMNKIDQYKDADKSGHYFQMDVNSMSAYKIKLY